MFKKTIEPGTDDSLSGGASKPARSVMSWLAIFGVCTLFLLINSATIWYGREPSVSMLDASNRMSNQSAEGLRKLSMDAVDVFTGFVVVLISLGGYANRIYPNLSPVYGGGKQQKLVLVAKPDQVTQLKSLGINISLNSRQIGPLELIYEAADYLILSTPEEIKERDHVQSIRLKKDMLDAILQVDSKYVKATPTQSPISTPIVDSRKSPITSKKEND